MNETLRRAGRVPSAILLAWTVAGAGWRPIEGQAPTLLTTERAYKNIQVLRGVPSEQLMPAMEFIRASLGVECDYCHEQDAYEKDDKEPKQTAREMMRMVFAINKENFDGVRQVTCYSCHRGSARPLKTPRIGEDEPAWGDVSRGAEIATDVPGVDELLEKYFRALGGKEALQKIFSRVEQGTVISGGRPFRAEILAKAPQKRLSIVHLPGGDRVMAYDGQTGWVAAPGRPVQEVRGSELEAAKFEADLFPGTRMRQIFSDLRVEGTATVRGRKAYLMAGLQAGQPTVRVYFDTESGMLLRLERYEESPLGRNPTRIDFADYRTVDGVKISFSRTVSRPRSGFTLQIEQVQHNVPVDDARFAKPTVDPPAPK